MVKFMRDVISRDVVSCTADTSVREPARRMAKHRVNALAVFEDASGELENVSRSHLARVYDRDIDRLTVETVMSDEVETIILDIPVSAAVMIMLDRKGDRLVIMHAKPAPQRPVGLLSLSDVIQDMAGER